MALCSNLTRDFLQSDCDLLVDFGAAPPCCSVWRVHIAYSTVWRVHIACSTVWRVPCVAVCDFIIAYSTVWRVLHCGIVIMSLRLRRCLRACAICLRLQFRV